MDIKIDRKELKDKNHMIPDDLPIVCLSSLVNKRD